MKKEALIKLFDRAIRLEEDASNIFAKHVEAATEWLDCSKEEHERIVEVLKTLGSDSVVHKKTLMKLRERVLKDDKNDF